MKKLFLCFSVLLSAVFVPPAMAASDSDQKEIGKFGSWTAYEFQENGGKVCYMAARPEKSAGKYAKRGDIVAMITHRPAESTNNVFSYMAGYAYKKGKDIDLSIDGKKYALFTQNDMAWALDAQVDAAITDGVKKGSKMVVKGTSAKGSETTDTFSLSGSTKAYDAISKACAL